MLLREFDSATGRVRDLGDPPVEIADDVDRFLEVAEERSGLFGELIEAAEENDAQTVEEIAERGGELEDESDRIASDLGADSCAD